MEFVLRINVHFVISGFVFMIKFPPIRGSIRTLPFVGKLKKIVRKVVKQSRSLILTFDMFTVAMNHISYIHVYERREGFKGMKNVHVQYRTKVLGHPHFRHNIALSLWRRYFYVYISIMNILQYTGFVNLFLKPLNTQHKLCYGLFLVSLSCGCYVTSHLFRGCHVFISLRSSLCGKPNMRRVT